MRSFHIVLALLALACDAKRRPFLPSLPRRLARDARDLLKALAAFNKGVQKEKKTKSSAVRKSRRRS